jgi:hypothetical protein
MKISCCVLKGCKEPATNHGMCQKHYKLWLILNSG